MSDDVLAHDVLSRLVSAVDDSWTAASSTPAAEGSDLVAYVTVETPDGARDLVAKACAERFVDPPAFRAEPRLQELVRRNTEIPIPPVVAALDATPADLPEPFFLVERRPGRAHENGLADLPPEARRNVVSAAGRHLADLHGVEHFDAFGPVVADATDAPPREVDVDGLRVEYADDSWVESFLARVHGKVDALSETRFSDLQGDVREYVETVVARLPDRPTPAILHEDYRLGNVLVDDGATSAVLDWGNVSTGDPLVDLAATESYLTTWPAENARIEGDADRAGDGDALDEATVEELRQLLHENYARGRELPDDADERLDVYRATARLDAMLGMSYWFGDASDRVLDARADQHREFWRGRL